MANFTAPMTINQVFANGDTNIYIPGSTSLPDNVNQVDGFPINQEKPIESGGIPVKRHEMNGAFNLLSQHVLWKEVGGQYTFDTLIANTGGYNKGAVLAYYNGDGSFNTFLYSTKDNNTDNFISTPSVIGTSWISTSVAQLPDIVDNITTGDVTIGGRVLSSSVTSKTNMPNGSVAQIITQDGGNNYPIASLNSGTSANQYSTIRSTYANISGVIKPFSVIQNSDTDGSTASISISSNSTNGFSINLNNLASNSNNTSNLVLNNNSSNVPQSSWYISNDNNVSTGINLDNNIGATLLGVQHTENAANLATVGYVQSQVQAVSTVSVQVGTGYILKTYKTPGQQTIYEISGQLTVTFDGTGTVSQVSIPFTFPTTILTIQAMIISSTQTGDVDKCIASCWPVNLSSIGIHLLNIKGGGTQNISYTIIGN